MSVTLILARLARGLSDLVIDHLDDIGDILALPEGHVAPCLVLALNLLLVPFVLAAVPVHVVLIPVYVGATEARIVYVKGLGVVLLIPEGYITPELACALNTAFPKVCALGAPGV